MASFLWASLIFRTENPEVWQKTDHTNVSIIYYVLSIIYYLKNSLQAVTGAACREFAVYSLGRIRTLPRRRAGLAKISGNSASGAVRVTIECTSIRFPSIKSTARCCV